MNKNTAKKTVAEIEAIIEAEIEKLSEEYDLDSWDIADIRTETYKANGWSYDPYPENEEEEEDDEYEEEWHYKSMSEMLWEVGMRESDFF